MRYALYFAPPAIDPLSQAAARWLGRDAFTGETMPLKETVDFDAAELHALTDDPRRYGFHGTLKAPFALAEGRSEGELLAELAAFAAGSAGFAIPELVLGQLGSFFALVPAGPCLPLQAHAADVVRHFEPFRAPLSEADIARRRPDRLPPRQRDNLLTWGYPYVFDDFGFHMTLTGPVPEHRTEAMRRLLEQRFAAFIGEPLPVRHLGLFVEPARGAPFSVHTLLPLSGPSNRKIA
ncbi:DUF1045 domain-containing protein [Pararhizobium sp.]|uniref:DUF1045 domain-containing protein n=1 Tax=Pararhizobium sp. TaxID=1977563 RepID=UPI00272135AC|nr:DUF1045 domain-containing protein [Pararhizobium sp.]MDO9415933.1 DUF1045 domain-containing protein [Pararhizobium sp.]